MRLYSVTITHTVPVWASSEEEAERLAVRCKSLGDFDCYPGAAAVVDDDACEPDEVPIGGNSRTVAELTGKAGAP